MRVVLLSSICVCLTMAGPAFAWSQGQAVMVEKPVASDEKVADPQVDAFDPFAEAEAGSPPEASNSTKSAPETASTQITDPFSDPATAREERTAQARITPSIDLLYQGSYTPGLIRNRGADSAEHDLFIDAALAWTPQEGATLSARVVANHEERKSGSTSSRRGEIEALEYFYRQQFTEGTQAFTIGRRLMGWSSGFQWRPADLIDNGFSTKSINIRDPYRYRGVDQIRYELVRQGFDFTAIVSNNEKRFFGGEQFAAKLGIKGDVAVSLMYAENGDYSRKYGVLVDTSLGWGTTLALEAVHVDVDREKLADAEHFGKTLESLSGIRRYEDIYLSLTKFIDDKRRINLEYFHNGRGFGDLPRTVPSTSADLSALRLRAVDPSIFSEQYIGRNYVYAAYTGHIDRWKLQWKPSILMNTGDDSYIGSFSVQRELRENSELSVYANTFHGGVDSEYGAITNGVGVGISYVIHLF